AYSEEESSSACLVGILYDSEAHPPRSTVRHRSEQKGRHSFSGDKRAALPHAGHDTVRSFLLAFTSEVAEAQVEGTVVLVDAGLLHALGQQEAHIQRVLVRADLRNARKFVGERQTEHLGGLLRRGLLVDALEGDEGRGAPAL